jgi:hypothetical protein
LFTRLSPEVKRAEDMLRDTLKGVAKASELDALTPEAGAYTRPLFGST